MADATPKNEYVRLADLLRGSSVTSIAHDVGAQILEERARTVLDLSMIRRQEDWSLLADKTVGAEGV